MDTLPPIRMNLTIQADKDPVLYQLLSKVLNKEARTRRVLNLATLGMYFEMSGTASFAPLPHQNLSAVNSISANTGNAAVEAEVATKPKTGITFNPDELTLFPD